MPSFEGLTIEDCRLWIEAQVRLRACEGPGGQTVHSSQCTDVRPEAAGREEGGSVLQCEDRTEVGRDGLDARELQFYSTVDPRPDCGNAYR